MSAALARKPAPIEELYCSAERIVLIRGVHYNLDLELMYLDIFGPPPDGARIRFVLAPGAEIRSRRADWPALKTGRWSWLSV
jgi:hypothetical protein